MKRSSDDSNDVSSRRGRGTVAAAFLIFLAITGLVTTRSDMFIASDASAVAADYSKIVLRAAAATFDASAVFPPPSRLIESNSHFCPYKDTSPPNEDLTSRRKRKNPATYVAGMMNTGTNWVYKHLDLNCPRSLDFQIKFMRYDEETRRRRGQQAYWGKHTFLSFFDVRAFSPVYNEDFPLVPIGCGGFSKNFNDVGTNVTRNKPPCRLLVVTRDPLDWASSSCRSQYPGMEIDKRCARAFHESRARFSNPDATVHRFANVAFAYNEWYGTYKRLSEFLAADPLKDDERQRRMRSQIDSVIFIRYEDLLVRIQETTERICECVAPDSVKGREIEIRERPAKSHGHASSYHAARERVLDKSVRRRSKFTDEDLRFFEANLDSDLLDFLGYSVRLPDEAEALARR